MSEAGDANWAEEVEQAAEMPAVKLFGRWTTDDVQVCFVWSPAQGTRNPIAHLLAGAPPGSVEAAC